MLDLARTTRNYVESLVAFVDAELSPDERLRVEAAAQALSPDDLSISAARLRGSTMSHAAWIHTSRIRSGLRAGWQALFQDVDVVLCPPMPTVAFRHDHSLPIWARVLDLDGKKLPYDDQLAWAGIATSNGLHATTMPIGHDDRGLPIGVQIIGGYLDDNTTITVAGLVEREFVGFTPLPNF
jgi:amidase